jgi:hypothetical protein
MSPDCHPAARDRLPADTVKKHVSHLLGKLGAANRTEAVTRARQLGLIPSKTPQPIPGGTGVFRADSAALSCRARHCGRFHRNAHLRVTPHGGLGSYRPRERFTQTGRGTPCRRART